MLGSLQIILDKGQETTVGYLDRWTTALSHHGFRIIVREWPTKTVGWTCGFFRHETFVALLTDAIFGGAFMA